MSKGWDVKFSRGSRGPADLYASKESEEWYIEVKASTKAPRIKGLDILRLEKLASSAGACPVLALIQPSINANPILSPGVSERFQAGDSAPARGAPAGYLRSGGHGRGRGRRVTS